LRKRLESIFNQTFRNYEVILLDDASTDWSVQVLREYEDHPQVSHLLINEQNSGSPFRQWEKGLLKSQGQFAWIAECDDFSDEHFLENIMKIFGEDDETGLVFSASWYADETGRIMKPAEDPDQSFTLTGKEFIYRYLARYNVIRNASSCVFKRELFDPENTNFKEFQYCGDWQFWSEVCRKARKVTYLADRLNFFRKHGGNVSSEAEKQGLYFTEGFRILGGILDKEKVPAGEKERISRFWGLKMHDYLFTPEKMTWKAKIRILLLSLYKRHHILRHALWNHKVKIRIRKLIWQ